ncbi:diguanylate cyclase domain-containing protein [Vibrio mediterranei]|uniref:diguanylate cyclase domain-containing protein n=1 Tax=Vibrio mediterranei TaxID=689 RepID=UPI00406872B6
MLSHRLCFLFLTLCSTLSSTLVWADFSPQALLEDKPYKQIALKLQSQDVRDPHQAALMLSKLQAQAKINEDPVATYFYYLGLFNHYRSFKRPIDARQSLIEMKQFAITQKLDWMIADADMWLSTFDITDGNYSKALQRATETLVVAKSTGFMHLEGRLHNLIAVIHSTQNRQLQAKQHYLVALEIFKDINDAPYVIKVLSNISLIYADLEEWDKALEYNLEGYAWLNKQSTPSTEQQAILAINRSIITGSLGDLREQAQYLKLADINANKLGDIGLIATVKGNKSHNLIEQGHYAQARILANDCLRIARDNLLRNQMPYCLTHLGRALTYLGESKKAEALLLDAKSSFVALNDPINTVRAYDYLAKFYEFQGEFEKAYHYSRLYQTENEILLFDKQKRALFELEQVHLDIERQSQLIQLDTENKLKQARLEQQDSIEKMWAATFVAGLFGFLLLFRSKSSLEQQNASLLTTNHSLREQSLLDPLTRVPNRRFAENFLDGPNLEQESGHFALGIIDIDHFKNINDQLGHAAGDIVLQEIAQTLSGKLHPAEILARWGGEEFLLVVKAGSLTELNARLEHFKQTVEIIDFYFDGGQINVTASIGATYLSQSNYQKQWHYCFDIADKNLYKAKAQGRNKVVFC